MTTLSFNRMFCHSTRLGLALVFVVAGTVKLSDIPEFAEQLGDFGLVYDALVLPAAWIIGLVELLTGLALAFNVRGSLICVLSLLVVFVCVLAYGIGLGLDIDCGCFGPGYRVSLGTQLFIDLGLVLWCAVVYWGQRRCQLRPFRPVTSILRAFRRGKTTA